MNRTVIITGASRGIGRAIAIRFAASGCNVIINSVNGGEKLEETAELCQKAYQKAVSPNTAETSCSTPSVLPIQGDVSDPSFVRKLIAEAHDRFGRIDVLVNNAGISFVGLIQDTDDLIWQKIINTNLSSVHYCTREVIPHMLNEKHGHIINISSVWGNIGASCEAAYSASKGGINAYTKAAAKELAPSGISVNAIACGCIDTDMNKCFSSEDLTQLAEEIPVGRLGTPEEIAEMVYSVSNLPEYLTGQIITADGGWT
ncbi:MAG: SDR family oxidoreductase [Lachnospiraceae bacterium]|nr:SDR family oxidoreductase [Lachnospiraceae bacterium]